VNRPQAAGSDQRTMMAQPAPQVNRPQAAGSDQRTMMAQPAPQVNRPQATSTNDQRTMLAQPAPTPQAVAQATQMLGDAHQGVGALASERAQQARAAAAAPKPVQAPAGTGALFWLAWVIIGVGAGLGAHFWLASRAQ
jgi:hypothetical protein